MLNSQQQKNICVYGLGQSGSATARYLQRTEQKFFVVDSRANPPGLEAIKALANCQQVYLESCAQTILNEAATIILSPGISPEIKPIKTAINAGVEVVGDIEVFVQNTKARIVAITGSNGKSTVTDLTCKLLCAAGINAKIGGNFGVPVLDYLPMDDADVYVLELSSFQLDTTFSLRADVAVVLNVSEDHMDRYADMQSYRNSKLSIYKNAKYSLVNLDEMETLGSFKNDVNSYSLFNSESRFHVAMINQQYWIFVEGRALINVTDLSITGKHNWSNVLAVFGILSGLNVNIDESVLKQLKNYRGLAHRFEMIASTKDCDWINDSKATNVGATIAALQGVDQDYYSKVILIAGGLAKGADLSPLAPVFATKIFHLILLGKDAKLLAALFDETRTTFVSSMQDAVKRANELLISSKSATGKSLVLLSPACASLDMFSNFEARGKAFADAVEAYR